MSGPFWVVTTLEGVTAHNGSGDGLSEELARRIADSKNKAAKEIGLKTRYEVRPQPAKTQKEAA